MKTLIFTILLLALAGCSVPTPRPNIKKSPEYSTEIKDPEISRIVDSYIALSKRNNVVFDQKVSIGFSKIDRGQIIGFCTTRSTFREIDLDSGYWERSSWLSKVDLLFHELTHCYCGRDHDFDNGTMYPDDSIKAILQGFFAKIPVTPLRPPGYLEDSCPKSIMHPVIMDDYCFEKHYEYYAQEMFARCQPF